jgi:hypothetical protein
VEPEKNIAEIFHILNSTYNSDGRFSDKRAIEGVANWAEIKLEDKQIPDYFFIANVCYGPWRDKRQKQVWLKAYSIFKEFCKGDLRLVDNSIDLGFPFKWQTEKVRKIASFLRDKGVSFTEFLTSLKSKSGLQARDEFRQILGSHVTKTVSTFIRDYLNLDIFPVDRRVRRMLELWGLPKDEDEMLKLCEATGVNPKELNRMLYS